jgi:2-polyprenyl-6-methoxyphenol hydroxylase-like FAD-dependent oxidoreductase
METGQNDSQEISVRCCVAGGGPAGIMLGLLLARAGVDVLVLEKHGDFLRDFRGDTIHPSTLEIMYELGILNEFLKLPHQEVRVLEAQIGDDKILFADFTHLPTHCKFIAFMPQWNFLNFIADKASRYPTFNLRMNTEATGLIEESGRVVGLNATTPDGPLKIKADLVVGADGRHSVIREKAGLRVEKLSAPIDVLWFKLPRHPGDPETALGRFDLGRIFIQLNQGDHWQCGLVIPKGSIEKLKEKGIQEFRCIIREMSDVVADRVDQVRDWNDISLLTVAVDRLTNWYREGLLCIGDAAHAMSPIGGVGINLAVADAVAAANILADPLRRGVVSTDNLRQVQRRRQLPMRVIQGMQIFIQNRIAMNILDSPRKLSPPLMIRLLAGSSLLRRIPARLIGMGFRPEHLTVKESNRLPGRLAAEHQS